MTRDELRVQIIQAIGKGWLSIGGFSHSVAADHVMAVIENHEDDMYCASCNSNHIASTGR